MYLGYPSFLEEEASALSSARHRELNDIRRSQKVCRGKNYHGNHRGRYRSIMLICSLPFVVGIALAAAMVYYGWKLMKNGSADNGVSSFDPEPASAAYQSHFDDEWEEFLKKK